MHRLPVVAFVMMAGALCTTVAAAAPPGASVTSASTTSGPESAAAVQDAPSGSPDEPFQESIEVSVVSLDVVVRDSSGKLVAGLTRGDFKLFLDGQQVEITNFAVGGVVAPTGTSGAEQPAAPPVAAETKRDNVNLVVFIDNANMLPFDRNRLLKQLRGFLHSTLQPGDRVLVVTRDPGLHVRHAFQESSDALGPELDKLEKESAAGLSQDLDRRQALDQMRDLIKSGGCRSMFASAKSLAQARAEAVLNQAKTTYDALHHTLKSLGGVEGRKVLLYVGNGVATQAGMDAFGLLDELCPAHQSQSHVTFDPVLTAGPMRQVILQADNPLTASLKVGAATPAEHGRVLVSVQVRVPFAKLSFLPQDDGRHGRLGIVVGSMDARGEMAAIQRAYLPLRIPNADLKKILASHFGYDVRLLIEPGHQRLAFLVRDDVAHVSSCVVQDLEVDKSGVVRPVASALSAVAASP